MGRPSSRLFPEKSPNQATNATKSKLAAADQKQGPPPGWLSSVADYVRPCRVDESGGWNGSPASVCQLVFQAG